MMSQLSLANPSDEITFPPGGSASQGRGGQYGHGFIAIPPRSFPSRPSRREGIDERADVKQKLRIL